MAKKSHPKKPRKLSAPTTSSAHHEGAIGHLADAVESRLLEAAEFSTATSSAETNVALTALAAIEGPPEAAEPESIEHGKRRSAAGRPKKR